MILSILLTLTFTLLGILHFYWAFGGKSGFDSSLPTNDDGERVLNPSKFDTIIVGLGLILFSIFYLLKSGVFVNDLPVWVFMYGSWIIPSIFFLRAVGEFKYVGFFKRVKGTKFAKMDTKVYSPLCLFIGTIGLLIQLMN